MQISESIEKSLDQAITLAQAPGAPPLLASALRYAVFPGGHRIRPQLCLSVAYACGNADLEAAKAAAAAIEFLHCASLVHDDVHAEFGTPIAVLTGDALIVLAFETLARGVMRSPERLVSLLSTIAQAVGAPNGIVAGQAWECESAVSLRDYQRAKTGSLFVAATVAGAIAAGVPAAPWYALGDLIGEAYQVADDLRDIICSAAELGKPIGQDAARLRPNAAAQLGIGGAKNRLEELLKAAIDSIPACPGADDLRTQIKAQTAMFFPKQLAREAA